MTDTPQMPAIIPVEFRTDYVPVNPKDPGSDLVPMDSVRWVKKGDAFHSSTWQRINQLKRLERAPEPNEWTIVKPAYEAWKRGQEIPLDGTPLEVWPGVSSEQAAALRRFNIRTVEDFRSATDTVLTKIPFPNVRILQRNAAAYLEARDRDMSVEQALASRDDELAQLRAEVARLRGGEAEEEEQPQPEDEPSPERRRPGRPRKVA